jgi:hypothetical protein
METRTYTDNYYGKLHLHLLMFEKMTISSSYFKKMTPPFELCKRIIDIPFNSNG